MRIDTLILIVSLIVFIVSGSIFGYHYLQNELRMPYLIAVVISIFGIIGPIGWKLADFSDLSSLKDISDRSKEKKDE